MAIKTLPLGKVGAPKVQSDGMQRSNKASILNALPLWGNVFAFGKNKGALLWGDAEGRGALVTIFNHTSRNSSLWGDAKGRGA